MFTWSIDRIRALAPDDNTWNRSRRLGHPPLWRHPAGNENMVWGECKGGGGSWYQTAIDLSGPAFRCSCPVRRPPCKHALALLLLLHNYPDTFRVSHDEPSWVARWRETRSNRQAAKEEKEDSPEKQAQRQKNRDKRLDAMAAGIDELYARLRDMVRQGLAAAEAQPPAFWEQMAARMTDAKLGSIARRLRLLAYPAAGEVRHKRILEEIGELFLLIEGFHRLERLPEALQQDLLASAGLAQRKDDLEGLPAVKDNWLALGVETGAEEQLQYRRVWLAGEESRRFALLLDFVWGDGDFPEKWHTGAVSSGALTYFPSAYPLRAVAQPMQRSGTPFRLFDGHPTLTSAAYAYAEALSLNPWLPQMPALLNGVIPATLNAGFLLVDKEMKCYPLRVNEDTGLRLLALGGGHPIDLFGEWSADGFRPLGVSADATWKPVNAGGLSER